MKRNTLLSLLLGGILGFALSACNGDPVRTDGSVCGTIQGITCPSGEYCAMPNGRCAAPDGQGVCRPKPTFCTREFKPVCGCDGRTYGNACMAAAADVSLDHVGRCKQGKPERCGGVAGLKCPDGQVCIDDPRDDCVPPYGKDCLGLCKEKIPR